MWAPDTFQLFYYYISLYYSYLSWNIPKKCTFLTNTFLKYLLLCTAEWERETPEVVERYSASESDLYSSWFPFLCFLILFSISSQFTRSKVCLFVFIILPSFKEGKHHSFYNCIKEIKRNNQEKFYQPYKNCFYI